jgi:hypothetical protein
MSTPEAIDLGRRVPLFKIPVFVQEYYLRAPPETIRRQLAWLDAQKGTRGRRVLGDLDGFALVTDDGVWTESRFPRAPEVLRKVLGILLTRTGIP